MQKQNFIKGLVSIEEYQKIKSAVEGTDNYHTILKEGKRDFIKKDFLKTDIKKKISIEKLNYITL